MAIDSRKLIRWYDFQAPFYSLWRDDYDGPLVREVLSLLRSEPGIERVLDAGCGTGMFCIGLALAEPGWRFDAVDASAGMLAGARRNAAGKGAGRIELRQGDVTELDFADETFDAVVTAGVMPCLNEPRAALTELRRVLRPGGRLVSVEFDRASMGAGTRAFFHVMILGYRVVSRVLPRFRYAAHWNIESSTIDAERYEEEMRAAGLTLLGVTRVRGHVVHHARRPDQSK